MQAQTPYDGYEIPPDWTVRCLDSFPGLADEIQFPQRYDWLIYDEHARFVCAQGHYLGFSTQAHVNWLWQRWYQEHWTNEEG